MQNKIITLTENDNIFDYLGDEITTVISVLESIYLNTDDYGLSPKNKAIILGLDKIHYYNDDLFNLFTNEVLTKEDILEKYYIKVFNYDLTNKFEPPKILLSLTIMEVFKHNLKKSA
ncbi:hypothetical protein MS2017_1984 [Bathymodiolus thermophilus thioautotrophic gill symbiont]|uniref:Uncharacterized protein n=1 Tax=Bathymodiolus thermophilus thioautotrophic gill symbiont TaxID=2360 RepID=A0A3G3IQ89_9GAMM|nr:hypothetical protein [Bathymodiolus thermophilus thioautotrophic gill symbiont]AYQ57642.1 hypothetical protein MS2017_1984 [Bathymodiolus thermophilus thioautotrophic gill symbiont]